MPAEDDNAGGFFAGVQACTPAKNPPALSSSAGTPSSDIVIRRSAIAPSAISTNPQSSGVEGDNNLAVTSSLDTGNPLKQGSSAGLSDDSQIDVATSVIAFALQRADLQQRLRGWLDERTR